MSISISTLYGAPPDPPSSRGPLLVGFATAALAMGLLFQRTTIPGIAMWVFASLLGLSAALSSWLDYNFYRSSVLLCGANLAASLAALLASNLMGGLSGVACAQLACALAILTLLHLAGVYAFADVALSQRYFFLISWCLSALLGGALASSGIVWGSVGGPLLGALAGMLTALTGRRALPAGLALPISEGTHVGALGGALGSMLGLATANCLGNAPVELGPMVAVLLVAVIIIIAIHSKPVK